MTYEEKLKKVNENLRYMEETAEKQRQTNAAMKIALIYRGICCVFSLLLNE